MKFGSVLTKLLLNENHKKSRYQFAEDNIARDWSSVMFTDEATFSTFTYKRKLWRRKNKIVVKRTVKGPEKVHVYGCFTKLGFGELYCFTGILNGTRMLDLYNKGLKRSVNRWFSSSDQWILQEDNDPKHTCTLAKSWKSSENVQMLKWPSASPDLNPIENVWGLLKARIKEKPEITLPGLVRRIRSEWKSLPVEYAENLVNSLTRRMASLIKTQGDFIMY